jgi:hypothetical protein
MKNENEDCLTDRQSNVVLLLWYVFLSVIIIVIVLSIYASAVSLSIVGNSTGTGTHFMSFAGDQINASIFQSMNNSTWQINASGAI